MECNTTKKFTDYTDEIMKEFPYLSKHDIEIIVRYGWRQIYFLNQRGGDTILNSHKYKYWLYIGELTKNPIKHFRYYRRKMQNKLRVMYTRKKIQWDGYYYVALTNEEYEELLESFNKKGRKRKYYTFSRRTSHIIISPAIPARSVHPAGKIHDIKVSERFHFVCHRLRIPVVMRPASRTFMQIAGIIAQGRIESSKKLDTRV